VRRPSPRLADGLLTHIERSSVDATSAAKQWEGYVGAFVGAGWRVTEVEPAPECPDSVFVEDTVVVYGDLAVIARSGAVERRSETQGTEKAAAELGYRIAHIEAPGVLRRRRDFARQRWPFGQFHLTRAGGFVGWAGCPATSSACGIRTW